MAEMFKVTGRVLVDHPDGYQVLAHVPGDEIPLERAVELGLVAEQGADDEQEPDDTEEKEEPTDDTVKTAEVRRPRRRASGSG